MPSYLRAYAQRTKIPMSNHVPTLYMVAMENNCKTIVELGVGEGYLGQSTFAFLFAARELGGHLVSIDIGPCDFTVQEVKRIGLARYWTFLLGDDLHDQFADVLDPKRGAITWKAPDSIDLLFIDTSHTYAQTLAELKKYEQFVKPGGFIILHDINSFPPVAEAIHDHFAGRDDIVMYEWYNDDGLMVIKKTR